MPRAIAKPFHPKYAVHPGVAMVQKWVRELKAKTGHSLDEWMMLCNKNGPKNESARRDRLKKEFGLGTNTARWLAERSLGVNSEDEDPKKYLASAVKYVDTMYAGKKAVLRPLHDALIRFTLKTLKGVRLCPCQTMVSVYRNHVIAQIKPATITRIDLGFALSAMKAKGRLIDTGGFAKKDRITHRIPISTKDDINADVARWLKAAYDLDK